MAQVALVSVGGTFPLWVDRNKQLVKFTVSKIEIPGGSQHQQQHQLSAMIGLGTELVVLDPAESTKRKKKIAAATALMNGKHKNSHHQHSANSARGVNKTGL